MQTDSLETYIRERLQQRKLLLMTHAVVVGFFFCCEGWWRLLFPRWGRAGIACRHAARTNHG